MAKKNMSWRKAILKVIGQSDSALHYTEIAEEIARQGLRKDLGATPASTVGAVLSQELKQKAERTAFVRTDRRGYYMLNPELETVGTPIDETDEDDSKIEAEAEASSEQTGFINAFGMYWRRDKVDWKTKPKILGQQQIESTKVDFCEQVGVYLLHSESGVVYVGKAVDQPLGSRLYQHTADRLNGRWTRFSWFGIRSVTKDGELKDPHFNDLQPEHWIAAMEALLIEGLEPPQNRRRGDELNAVEYMQATDTNLEKKERKKLLQEVWKQLEE